MASEQYCDPSSIAQMQNFEAQQECVFLGKNNNLRPKGNFGILFSVDCLAVFTCDVVLTRTNNLFSFIAQYGLYDFKPEICKRILFYNAAILFRYFSYICESMLIRSSMYVHHVVFCVSWKEMRKNRLLLQIICV